MNAPLAPESVMSVHTQFVEAPPEALALQRLYHWERTQPQRVAFVQPIGNGEVREFTWAEVLQQTRRIATHLQQRGFEPGSKIAILAKNCAWWLMADYAIWMAGHVSVPLYPTLAADTIGQVLSHSEARLLFIGKLDNFDAMAPGIPAGLPCVSMPLAPERARGERWDALLAACAPLAGEPLREPGELCTLMYTSGTTGAPKGVMHSFGNFAWAISSGLRRLEIDHRARMLSYLPLSHVAERTLLEHGQLATGMRVYFAERLETFTADLQRARPTCFFSVPRLWVKFQQGVLARMPQAKLDRLLRIPLVGQLVRKKVLAALGLDKCRVAAGGAAPMPPELLRWYERLGLSIVEVYGMTENCGVSHATVVGLPQPGTVGIPYEGVESRLDPLDGEIQMRSPAVMQGYFKEPELTREAFTEDGWLHTGDKGQYDEQGNLRITGRVKDLFKTSKGKYVAPAPIEDKLVMHPAVEACCVSGASLGQPLALLMLNADAVAKCADTALRAELAGSLAEHLQAINQRLDPHEQLACLVIVTEAWTVDNGLITPTFKIKRNRVETLYAHHYESWTGRGQAVVWAQD